MGRIDKKFVAGETLAAEDLNKVVAGVNETPLPDGYYEGMRTGSSDALAPSEQSELAEYAERLPSARMVAYSPDNTSMIGAVSPDSESTPILKHVHGDVVGGNQCSQFITTGVIIKVNDCKATFNGTIYYEYPLLIYSIKFNHKYMWLIKATSESGSIRTSSTSFYPYLSNSNITKGIAIILTANGSVTSDSACFHSDGNADNGEITSATLDLTTLFPSEQTWVNNLGSNDAQKVLHRLGFGSYNVNGTTVTENTDSTLQMGAEDIALLGYKEPTLDLANVGGLNLIDSSYDCYSRNGAAPRIKQTINFSNQLNSAWGKLKQELTAKGVDIPSILNNPRLFKVNDTIGVRVYKDRIEVSAWMKVFDGSENWAKGNGDFYCNISHFSRASSNSNVAVISNTNMRSTSLSGFTDNCLSIDEAGIMRASVLSDYSTVEEFRNYIDGKTYIYELAEPITIYFDEPINLSFADADGTDLIGLIDMDGNPLYDVKIASKADGSKDIDMRWNKTWVETNKQIPTNVSTVLKGMGFKADYDTIFQMYQDIQQLKNR